jgi:hypothetical protein
LDLHVIGPSRIDRARLDAIDFPVKVEVPLRFDDLDRQGQVNNAAAGVILQERRVGLINTQRCRHWPRGCARCWSA